MSELSFEEWLERVKVRKHRGQWYKRNLFTDKLAFKRREKNSATISLYEIFDVTNEAKQEFPKFTSPQVWEQWHMDVMEWLDKWFKEELR